MPTVVLKATRDTYVESVPGTKLGGWNEPLLMVGQSPESNGLNKFKAVIQFDFSSIPSGSTITSAVLSMKFRHYHGDFANNYAYIEARKVHGPINSGTTWNTVPANSSLGLTPQRIDRPATLPANTLIEWECKDMFADRSNMFGVALWMTTFGPAWTHSKCVWGFESLETTYSEGAGRHYPTMTISYNSPPTAPTVTSPNGGETLDQVHTITWNESTDAESPSSALKYEIGLSRDNGLTWSVIVPETAAGATSYNYNFVGVEQTSQAKIRIRAFDGEVYSGYDVSDGVFTISHNNAPTQPTDLSPSTADIKDRDAVIRFSWTHNDPNADNQAKFDLRWREQGTTTWNTVTQTTANRYYDMPASTITANGMIEWQVRTYDTGGLNGPYSELVAFRVGAQPDAPVIIEPEGIVIESRPVVAWTALGQIAYKVTLYAADGVTELWTTGTVNSLNTATTIGFDLVNLTDYVIAVEIKNDSELWSDQATVAIHTNFTPPSEPLMSYEEDRVRGSLVITINNPQPIGDQPEVSFNDVYRRRAGGEWVRIGTGVAEDGTFTDYTPASDVLYDYKVRAWGINGVYTDSAETQTSVSVRNTQLAQASDLANTWFEIVRGTRLSGARGVKTVFMEFAGRENEVAEFGNNKFARFTLSGIIMSWSELEYLGMLSESKEVILLRDSKGRKEYVVFDGGMSYDEMPRLWNVNMNLRKIDYTEGV